jgi:membrane protein
VRIRRRALVQKFFADRGTHLSAMIAYFALLSFVPLTFLALSVLGVTGRADESSFLVRELNAAFPGTEVERIVTLVRAVQDNAATLGIVGAATLVWASLSLFSVLESALNVVYARPNRSFLHGKAVALLFMVASLVTLFVALLAGSLGYEALRRYTPGLAGNAVVAYVVSVAVSTLGVFAFLLSVYTLLVNAPVSFRAALPGSLAATVALEATFQVLPIYERWAGVSPAMRAFGGPVILLVWLYVMANFVIFGAELNWWLARRRTEARP